MYNKRFSCNDRKKKCENDFKLLLKSLLSILNDFYKIYIEVRAYESIFDEYDYFREYVLQEKKRGRPSGSSNKLKVECKECNKLFASESRLKAHLNSHKMEICVCEFCDDSHTNRIDLAKHIRSVHKVTYSCKYCGHILNNQRQYERHLKKSHEDEYPGMYNHKIRKYDFVCRYCQEPQSSYKALKIHTQKHRQE